MKREGPHGLGAGAARHQIGASLSELGALGLEAAPLIPTRTGLSKCILDATEPVRELLKRAGTHDFWKQGQGQDRKVVRTAFFVEADGLRQTTASLYRPSAKQGDPRIWFSGLAGYAQPEDLILLVPREQVIYVINANSRTPLRKLARLIPARAQRIPSLEHQLLGELRAIRAKGWLKSDGTGPTAVGMALEHALGIPPNSSKVADYMSTIELKAQRLGNPKGRVTLFSATPAWDVSPLKSSRALLDTFGYHRGGKKRLYCTVSSRPNPQGLFLKPDADEQHIWLLRTAGEGARRGAAWPADRLRAALMQKHRRTAWVEARARKEPDGRESFLFETVRFSSHPLDHLLVPLVGDGTITVDLTLKSTSGGATDHGYLFKVRKSSLPALFGRLAAPIPLGEA